MPKTLKQLEEHADSLAERFMNYEPRPKDERDPRLYRGLYAAVEGRAAAERAVADAVLAMRGDGSSWATIGGILGTTGQAAQQSSAMAASSQGSRSKNAQIPEPLSISTATRAYTVSRTTETPGRLQVSDEVPTALPPNYPCSHGRACGRIRGRRGLWRDRHRIRRDPSTRPPDRRAVPRGARGCEDGTERRSRSRVV